MLTHSHYVFTNTSYLLPHLFSAFIVPSSSVGTCVRGMYIWLISQPFCISKYSIVFIKCQYQFFNFFSQVKLLLIFIVGINKPTFWILGIDCLGVIFLILILITKYSQALSLSSSQGGNWTHKAIRRGILSALCLPISSPGHSSSFC